MKIAIVDDMHRDRICLASYIKKYFSTRNVPYEIVEFSSGEEFLDHFVKDAYDLVFMDIYMKQKNGMEAAKEVYQKDPKVSIVFQSTSDEFGVASYAVHALYYLLKPYSEEEFIQAMGKYQKQKGFEEPVLEIVSERVDIQLEYHNIYFLDTIKRKTAIHTKDYVFLTSSTFAEISEMLLKDRRFLMCRRGVLVNMEMIEKVESEVFRLKKGESVPLHLRNKSKIKQEYLSFMTERMHLQE